MLSFIARYSVQSISSSVTVCPTATFFMVKSPLTRSFHCVLRRNARVTAPPWRACTSVVQEFIQAVASWALLAITQQRRYSVIGRKSKQSYDVAIVGAGLVGLATARELLIHQPELSVVVLEKESVLASQQSGHNSGVIHSGIYYTPGSLKARACVAGHRAMLEFCQDQGIPFELCGKVIVALDESELPRLEDLYQRGIANGVQGLELIGPERLRELEPFATGIKAIYSPQTGITDFVKVAHAYAHAIQQCGGEIITGCKVAAFSNKGKQTLLLCT